MKLKETKFSDVCGIMDELKRLLVEEYEKVANQPFVYIKPLLEDALSMVGRMKKRLEEYKTFGEKVKEIVSILDQIEEVDINPAREAVKSFECYIRCEESFRKAKIKEMGELAEIIRSVAGTQENKMRSYKDLCLKLYELLDEIRGGRPWIISDKEISSFKENIQKKYQAWLPPQPHCDKLLEFISKSRAHIVEEGGPGTEPLIEFEDGGAIYMSRVRYDEKLDNFYPASFKPIPSARKYRETPISESN